MTIAYKPLIMGMTMGLLMLWMLHGQLTNTADLSGLALAVFLSAHIAIGLVVIMSGFLAARHSPRFSRLIPRLHWPSWRHVGWMLGSACITAFLVHVAFHGLNT